MFATLVHVALGGAVGSTLRYLIVWGVGSPWGTAIVNVLGSFVMGVLFVVLSGRGNLSPLLMTGILGGFTTFSAFSLDTLKLWQAGQLAQAVLYVGVSVAMSLVAVALGAAFAKGAFG